MTITKEAIEAAAKRAADAVGVTPHSDMRLFVEQAVKYALSTLPIAGEGKVTEEMVLAAAKAIVETPPEERFEDRDGETFLIRDLRPTAFAAIEAALSALISSPGKDGGQEVEAELLDVIAERQRQIGFGYDAAHDDEHRGGEIIQAEWGVMRRIDDAIDAGRSGDSQAYMRFLTQAAAQLVAEVGRVKRALAKEAAR